MFDHISRAFTSLFSRVGGQKKLSKEAVVSLLEPVREALIQADVSYSVVEAFCADVASQLADVELASNIKADEYVAKVVYDRLVAFLGGSEKADASLPRFGSTIMVLGVQGSGKTTTVAKLGRFLAQVKGGGKRRVLVGSVDFYRPAAIDQLEIVSRLAGVDFYRAQAGTVVDAAVEINDYARAHRYDYVILDTAGRMHVDENLVDELRAIDERIKPEYKILVLDAMTGQESLRLARTFDERVGFSSAILTKVDSETRGGCAFAFRYELKKPILFVGVGEKVEEFERFYPARAATQMLGMGDVASLSEKIDAQIRKDEQEQLVRALNKKDFTLEDFAQQLDMMGRLGSVGQLLRYLPGGGQLGISKADLERSEYEMKRFRAILSSMTRKERLVAGVLNLSRKERIARGSGVTVEEVNRFLGKFDESRKMLKQFQRMGR